MSVINRMLKDIDRRNTASADASPVGVGPRRLAPRRSRTRLVENYLWVGGAIIGVCAIGVIGWRHWHAPVAPVTVGPAAIVTPAAPAAIAVTPAAPTAIYSVALTPPAVVVGSASALPASIAAPVLQLPAPAESVVRAVPPVPAETLKLSMKLSALVAETPVVAESVRRPAPPALPGKTTITNTPVRQVAAEETLAAARVIWHEGSRAAALATLREALAAAESTRDQRAIVLLGREIARLEVADNRPQAALDLLKRLEGQFVADADALALRGNAEQRLGLHVDATESYLAALKLKPNEGKWMLGAAISLAANGKLDEAQGWVDRARERDAITPTIGAYLRQLGINTGR